MKILKITGKGNGSEIGQTLADSGVLHQVPGRAASFSTPESFDLSVETTSPQVRATIEAVLTGAGLTDLKSDFIEESGGVFVNPHETDD